MKYYQVYSFDYTVEPSEQDVRLIAICDNKEDATMIYEKHLKNSSSNEMVRIREVRDPDLIKILNAK